MTWKTKEAKNKYQREWVARKRAQAKAEAGKCVKCGKPLNPIHLCGYHNLPSCPSCNGCAKCLAKKEEQK